MSGSGQEALPNVREWSGGPPGCPGVVGMSSQMSGSGQESLSDVREALPDVRVWSRGPPGCPRVVGSGREAHLDVWKWSGVVGSPSRMSRSGSEALLYVRR